MKKFLLTMAIATATLASAAQVVEVQSITRVPLQADIHVNTPCISPDGTFAIVSTNDDNSLCRIDLATGAVSTVTDNGSTLRLAFTPDGSSIIFRRATVANDHRRFYSVESLDLNGGATRCLAVPARHGAGFSISPRGTLSLNAEGRYRARALNPDGLAAEPYAIVNIHYGHLEVTYPDGRTVNLDPQGRGSYLWASLSPDGKRITYFLVGHGCYVCNLDGSDVRSLGYIHAPAWLGNDAIVGCQDYDNGVYITSSSIVAADLDGTIQTLTDESIIGINPSASADAKVITFSDPTGALYVINLK